MHIRFETDMTTVSAESLVGFFVGWPSPPTPDAHLDILRCSYRAVVAFADNRAIGFITAISDGRISAYLPLLEVLPEYQGQGIGTKLVERILAGLDGLYMVDLCCDAELTPFYERVGMQRSNAMIRRNYAALTNGEVS